MQNLKYKKSDLYDTVVDEYGVFKHNYQFMMFLAVLGYINERPRRNDYTGSEQDGTQGNIAMSNFYSQDLYRVFAASLAYQDTGDPEDLVNTDEHMRVMAQYSAGGLEIAEREFGSIGGDPTDAIMHYISETGGGGTEADTILAKIRESFDDEMMDTNAE